MDKPMPGEIFYTNPPVEIKGLMTLRDYFAAQAMQGDISAGVDVHPDEFLALASRAYKIADAMLKARMEKNI